MARNKKVYSFDEMAAGLCLWEAVLETDRGEELPALKSYFVANGTWAVRHAVIDMTAYCELVWLTLTDNGEDDRITYDWEFCPAYIRHCADWRYGMPIRDIKACVAKLCEGRWLMSSRKQMPRHDQAAHSR
jgi:hypothetical protein